MDRVRCTTGSSELFISTVSFLSLLEILSLVLLEILNLV